MNTLRLESKKVVKSRNTVNPAGWDMQRFCDKLQCLFVQVPERLLDGVQGFNQCMALVAISSHFSVHNFPALILGREGGLGGLHAIANILVAFKGSPHFLSKVHQVLIAVRVALPRMQLSSFSSVYVINRQVFDLRLYDLLVI